MAVLRLRSWRAVSRQLAGDHRAALPEFEALADAFARVGGPSSEDALNSRAQAVRCRGELGQVTEALAGLNDVLHVVSAVDGDVNENAVELRRDIGMLLLAQGRTAEAFDVLEPLHADLCLVFGPDDELTAEVAETLAVIRLDFDGGGLGSPAGSTCTASGTAPLSSVTGSHSTSPAAAWRPRPSGNSASRR